MRLIMSLCLAMTILLPACAERDEAQTHAALTIDGAPVDPFCFLPVLLSGPDEREIALRDCGAGYVRTDDFDGIEGFISAGFREADLDPDIQTFRPAFIAYHIAGITDGGLLAIKLMGSGGGSGVFSQVFTARREGDSLHIADYFGGGDRCFGGVGDVSVKGDNVTYSFNTTPLSFLQLDLGHDRAGEGLDMTPYLNMPDCAICCAADAIFRDQTLVGVHIPESDIQGEQPGKADAQACFERIVNPHGGQTLSVPDYQKLRDEIIAQCAAQ